MDRKEYLNLCQSVSKLKSGARNIKSFVPDDMRVIFDEVEYYPVGYEIEFKSDGEPIHKAILHSLKADCLIRCQLDKVERKIK